MENGYSSLWLRPKLIVFRALKLHFVLKAPPVSILSMNYHNQNFIGTLKFCLNIIQAGKDHWDYLFYCSIALMNGLNIFLFVIKVSGLNDNFMIFFFEKLSIIYFLMTPVSNVLQHFSSVLFVYSKLTKHFCRIPIY